MFLVKKEVSKLKTSRTQIKSNVTAEQRTTKINKEGSILFPRQSLKIFTFRVKLSGSIFFMLGLSPIVKLI